MASQYVTYYFDVFIPRNPELAVSCSLAFFYNRNFKTCTILVENLKTANAPSTYCIYSKLLAR